jgi:Zn-dependent protease
MINTLFHDPLSFVITFIALIMVIAIHEFAHGWAAGQLGDPTARLAGRLTLNPIKHLDPIGTILMLLTGFGWGKPTPFDPYNLKNPRKDGALIAIAGPLSNFLTAIILAIVLRILILTHNQGIIVTGTFLILPFIQLSLGLGIFNLVPIDPLDGFKIVGGFLNDEQAAQWYSLRRYGLFFLLLLFMPLIGGTSLVNLIIQPIFRTLFQLLVPIQSLVL